MTTNLMMLSRELRRVPLDFDAPIGETWAPMLERPSWHSFPACPTCGPAMRAIADFAYQGEDAAGNLCGDGLTPEARQLDQTWFALHVDDEATRAVLRWDDKLGQHEVDALIRKRRLDPVIPCPDGCRPPDERGLEPGESWKTDCAHCEGKGWTRQELKPGEITASEINRRQRESGGLSGHDGLNQDICVEARCELLGFEVECPDCEGHGDIAIDELRKKREEWELPEPPSGRGYQLWQTVSEGGPVSPVFETAEALARWLAADDNDIAGRYFTEAEWLQIVRGEKTAMELDPGR